MPEINQRAGERVHVVGTVFGWPNFRIFPIARRRRRQELHSPTSSTKIRRSVTDDLPGFFRKWFSAVFPE